MLNKLKELCTSLLKDNLDKEQVDTLNSISLEIEKINESFNAKEVAYNELKDDYIKVVKSNSFGVTAEHKEQPLTLEDIAKEIVKKGG